MCVCVCVCVCGELCGLAVDWQPKGARFNPHQPPLEKKRSSPLAPYPGPRKINSKLGTWPIARLGMDKTTGCAYSTKVQVGLRVPIP